MNSKLINKPLVISFEGGEGAGKTTVISLLKSYFENENISFVITREPGGVPISERIRDIILDTNSSEMDARTEALLFAAARRQHLVEKVLPALADGKIVVFDRFVDSSVVYQGFVRGIGTEEVYDMNLFATENFLPDITFYLDLDAKTGIERINQNPSREINKLDLEGMKFHEKVREGYLIHSHNHPERIKVIDASESPEIVLDKVLKEIEVYLQR